MDSATIRRVFPVRFRYYMELNRKTRNDLVKDLGFKYSTIRDWEKGITIPRMDKVEILARYFGCENSDLINETTEETKKPVQMDGLTENQRILLEFARQVPDDKAEMILRVVKSILGDEQ